MALYCRNPLLNCWLRVRTYEAKGDLVRNMAERGDPCDAAFIVEALHIEKDPALRRLMVMALKRIFNASSIEELLERLRVHGLLPKNDDTLIKSLKEAMTRQAA